MLLISLSLCSILGKLGKLLASPFLCDQNKRLGDQFGEIQCKLLMFFEIYDFRIIVKLLKAKNRVNCSL